MPPGDIMRSMAIALPRMLTAALCAAVFVGCGAGADVDEESLGPPVPTVVLQGAITGLGTRRPVVLQYNGTDVCINAAAPSGARVECRFFGVLNQTTSAFTFGALPVGTRYDIKVKTQPFGKQCTVANGVGTLSAAPTSIAVTCVNDPAVPRYSISGSVNPAVAALPGAKVILATEEGVREQPLDGMTAFQFDQALFNSGTILPVFGYAVTATFTGTDGRVNNCNVTNGTNVGADGNATAAPTGAISNVQVAACTFPVSVTVTYSGTPAQAIGAGGVTLELRDPRTGEKAVLRDPVSGADVVVPPLNITSSTSASFTRQLLSNSTAIYDLVITANPDGQTCVVGSSTQLTQGSAVLLINPADTANSFFINKNVRCRATPAAGAQLRGTYQQSSIATATGAVTYNRNFLTFFENGTFLFGLHATGANCAASCGVEHGFYAYNSVSGSIAFTPLTDTVTGANANRLSSNATTATLTNVVMLGTEPRQITATHNASMNWLLTALPQIAGKMTGSWVTADKRRMWVYDVSTYAGFHAGVNGLGNAQDACFAIDDPAALSGILTRRGNATTCQLGPGDNSIFTLDIPSGATSPRFPEGYVGKWPQSGSNADGRPSSPVRYTIDPGATDRLTVQNTLHDGTPVDPAIIFFRMTPN
jgi:hypothetical protein